MSTITVGRQSRLLHAGVAAFVVTVLWLDITPWALPFGIVMVIVGLVAFSLAT